MRPHTAGLVPSSPSAQDGTALFPSTRVHRPEARRAPKGSLSAARGQTIGTAETGSPRGLGSPFPGCRIPFQVPNLPPCPGPAAVGAELRRKAQGFLPPRAFEDTSSPRPRSLQAVSNPERRGCTARGRGEGLEAEGAQSCERNEETRGFQLDSLLVIIIIIGFKQSV